MQCTELVVGLDRNIEESELHTLIRDLGWVGFEMTTLAPWTGGSSATSDRWIFLSVET
jgi:hypothetical protein